MKKALALLLALVMCVSFAACGGGSSEESEKQSPEAAVKDAAEWDVAFRVKSSGYTIVPSNVKVTKITETSENQYEIYGTFTCKNEYGETVQGKFDGTGNYNPETEKASVNLDLH